MLTSETGSGERMGGSVFTPGGPATPEPRTDLTYPTPTLGLSPYVTTCPKPTNQSTSPTPPLVQHDQGVEEGQENASLRMKAGEQGPPTAWAGDRGDEGQCC